MRKWLVLLFVCIPLLSCPVLAADGNVHYSGNAGSFIFTPGSEHSPTDLFPNFKDIMPGDRITQKITVKNDASNKVKVKIYMRSLGAHPDSKDFLSQLHLQVETSEENTMAYMFNATADEAAQLTNWVCLGTLYSGGEVNLNVFLDVPVTLDNNYQQLIGFIDWEFMIEEYEIQPTDPQPPTGDNVVLWHWYGLLIFNLFAILLFFAKRQNKKA